MIRSKKTTVFTVYILLSISCRSASANFPSIRPIPCTNHVTGDSGICTFNWSCVNVAHGVHIGPCVDRFFVGTCCKVPQGTAQDDGQAKDSQMHPHHPFYDTLAPKVQEEKINAPLTTGQDGSTQKPFAHDDSSSSSIPETDSKHQEPSFMNYSSSSNSEKPVLPTASFHYLFSSFKDKNTLYFTTPSSVLYNLTDINLHSTISGLQIQHKPVMAHNGRVPVAVEATHNLRKPVVTHHSYDSRPPVLNHQQHNLRQPVPLDEAHDLRWPVLEEDSHDKRLPNQPVKTNEQHDSRKPVPLDEAHDLRWPVLEEDSHDKRLPNQPVKTNEQHDIRKPVPLDEAHDLRWPVLEEDSHDRRSTERPGDIHDQYDRRKPLHPDVTKERFPAVHLFEWLGKWYLNLNNHQKSNDSNNFYSLMTTQQVETSTSTTLPLAMTTKPTVKEEFYSSDMTTETLVSTSSSITSTDGTGNTNPISPSSNFTSFTRSTYEPPSYSPQTTSASIQEPDLPNTSLVCGRSRSGGTMARIVGGRKSRYLRWPWMISLRRFEDKTFKHKCGATLLNEYWAITAAHCVEGKLPAELLLRLGDHNFRRADELHPHVERRVYVMVLHPGFDPVTYENDLALLRFDEPVVLQANIAPVCLPDAMDDITGRMAVVTGWGRLSEAGELPASLHEVQMPIISNEDCEQMYYEAGYTEHIRDVFVCAGLSGGGLDACEGDSGGPMMLRGDAGQWTLVGLISWGMGCAAPKQPGVYTRISHFTHWIEGIIAH